MTRTIVHDWMLLCVCVLDGHDIVKQLYRARDAKVKKWRSRYRCPGRAVSSPSYVAVEMAVYAFSLIYPASIRNTDLAVELSGRRIVCMLPRR